MKSKSYIASSFALIALASCGDASWFSSNNSTVTLEGQDLYYDDELDDETVKVATIHRNNATSALKGESFYVKGERVSPIGVKTGDTYLVEGLSREASFLYIGASEDPIMEDVHQGAISSRLSFQGVYVEANLYNQEITSGDATIRVQDDLMTVLGPESMHGISMHYDDDNYQIETDSLYATGIVSNKKDTAFVAYYANYNSENVHGLVLAKR